MSTPRTVPDIHRLPSPGPPTDLSLDPRWKLVERIAATQSFQKSAHLPALLLYLAEHSIRGHFEALTERQIGVSVFGKPAGYSPAEDSTVRVHVRHLRLRLHEYYAGEGHTESLLVEIPKGSYILEFRPIGPTQQLVAPQVLLQQEDGGFRRHFRLPVAIVVVAVVAACICAAGWYRSASRTSARAPAPWPLNAVIQPNQPTRVVVADANSMLRLLAGKRLLLDQYLQSGFLSSNIPQHLDPKVSQLISYISQSQLTSYADLIAATTLVRLAGEGADRMIVCSSRDINERDLERGNYIFIGGPTSNPWVSLFEDKLNFEVIEDQAGGKMYFRNKHPKAGEQSAYEGLPHTGSSGDDWATISLLPSNSGQGNVLILQGLRQEGTEALGVLLATPADRLALEHTLGIGNNASGTPVYFEALIRAHSVAGAPVSMSVVATRTLSHISQN